MVPLPVAVGIAGGRESTLQMCGQARISHLPYCCPARSTFHIWNMNRMTNYLLFAQEIPNTLLFTLLINRKICSDFLTENVDCGLNFQLRYPWETPWALWGIHARVGLVFSPASLSGKQCWLCADLSQGGRGSQGTQAAWPPSGAQTPICGLSNTQLSFREREVHSARPRSPAAGTGKEPGWEGTGNPVGEVCYSETTAKLGSSHN